MTQPYDRNNLHFTSTRAREQPDAVKVHGLTDEFLADKPTFANRSPTTRWLTVRGRGDHPQRGVRRRLPQRRTAGGWTSRRIHEVVSRVSDSLLMAREMFPGKCQQPGRAVPPLRWTTATARCTARCWTPACYRGVHPHAARGLAGRRPQRRRPHPYGTAAVDLAGFVLPVLQPLDARGTGARGLLKDLDKASGGKTLWRPAATALRAPNLRYYSRPHLVPRSCGLRSA